MRALTVLDMENKKYDILNLSEDFLDLLGPTQRTGVWFIWGSSSNGKTSFALQICKELMKHGRVCYDSLEELAEMTMRDAIVRTGFQKTKNGLLFYPGMDMKALSARLNKRNSPDFIVIDSVQYSGFKSFKEYKEFVNRHKNKLFIFTSQAAGKFPKSKLAEDIMFDASKKLWVEGYKAFCKGRNAGKTGEYVIWEEGAERYWGFQNEEFK